MRLVRRLIYFSAAFTLTAGAVVTFLHQRGRFTVAEIPIRIRDTNEEIAVRGRPATASEMRKRLEKATEPFIAKRIWEIDLDRVKASIIRDEWVEEALISRSFPNGLNVEVRPKTPVLILVNGSGEFRPVVNDGGLLSPLAAGDLPDVPLLRGEVFINGEGLAKRASAAELLLSLPGTGALSRSNVSELTWAPDDGYVLTLIEPRTEVKLGEGRRDLMLKVQRVNQVLNYMSGNELEGRVIDASFSKKVLVRLRKAP